MHVPCQLKRNVINLRKNPNWHDSCLLQTTRNEFCATSRRQRTRVNEHVRHHAAQCGARRNSNRISAAIWHLDACRNDGFAPARFLARSVLYDQHSDLLANLDGRTSHIPTIGFFVLPQLALGRDSPASGAQRSFNPYRSKPDFHGAMDGASKFVKGDAVAGILILAINVIGGLAIGTLQHDLSVGEAAQLYVLLSIGDGLVAQIPSLLLSIATAIIVTRVSSSQDMAQHIKGEISMSRAWFPVAGVLGLIGLVPGMPTGRSVCCHDAT